MIRQGCRPAGQRVPTGQPDRGSASAVAVCRRLISFFEAGAAASPAPCHGVRHCGRVHVSAILLNEFHLNGVADIGPRLWSKNLAQLSDVRGAGAHQIPDRRLEARISTSISSVGMPRSITQVRLALPDSFDPREEVAQPSCPGVPPRLSYSVAAGRPVLRGLNATNTWHAIRAFVAAVAKAPLAGLRRIAFKVVLRSNRRAGLRSPLRTGSSSVACVG